MFTIKQEDLSLSHAVQTCLVLYDATSSYCLGGYLFVRKINLYHGRARTIIGRNLCFLQPLVRVNDEIFIILFFLIFFLYSINYICNEYCGSI